MWSNRRIFKATSLDHWSSHSSSFRHTKMEGAALFLYFLGSILTSYNDLSPFDNDGMRTAPIFRLSRNQEEIGMLEKSPSPSDRLQIMEGTLSRLTQNDVDLMGMGDNKSRRPERFDIKAGDMEVVYNLTVEQFMWSHADGVPVITLGINLTLPCPVIRATEGDFIRLNVTNGISPLEWNLGYSNTTIHWHGLFQHGTMNHDGMGHVTQCPIKAEKSREYHFKLKQSGTYWYHSHIRSQYTTGLRGAFIIDPKEKKYDYDDSYVLTLADWYHNGMRMNEAGLLSPKDRATGNPYPHSILLNGVGRYNCTVAKMAKSWNKPCDPSLQVRPVFTLLPENVTAFHIVNMAAIASFNFTIDGHDLEIVEVEGSYLSPPKVVGALQMAVGNRYAFRLRPQPQTSTKDGQQYLIRAYLHTPPRPNKGTVLNWYPNSTFNQVTGVIRYTSNVNAVGESREGFNYTQPIPYQPIPFANLTFFNDSNAPTDNPTLGPYTKNFTLQIEFVPDNETVTHGSFNGKPFILPEGTPVLYDMLENNGNYPPGVQNYDIEIGDVVQVVVNSQQGTHPIHLHGHNFQIMREGSPTDGNYDPTNPNHTLSTTGVFRDTAVVPGGGHLVFRFQANNPGVWVMHCHIDWHLVSGMMVVFTEGAKEAREQFCFPETDRQLCRDHGIPMNPAPPNCTNNNRPLF